MELILELEDLGLHLVLTAQMLAVILTTAHILLSDRDVASTVGWTGLVWLAPLIGLLIYWVFGVNRIQRKAHRLRPQGSAQSESARIAAEDRAHHLLEQRYPHWVALGHLGDALTQSVLESGNRVRALINGDQAYPEMLRAIDGAHHSIALSTYIFDIDAAGRQFVAALERAHRRGIKVRVLIDAVGQRYSRPRAPRLLARLGVPVAVFLESLLPIRSQYLNLRNHRKILVVDGRVGFTGGLNIRGGCLLANRPRNPVQDLHFHLEGPVVRGLMSAFEVDWHFTTGERLSGNAWFPPLMPLGDSLARCLPDGPDEDFDVIRRMMLGALAQARQRVCIISPYFLPDQVLLTALNVTALRGVDVRILLPERNNLRFVEWAAQAQTRQILAGGSRMFLSPPPFDHTKLMLVDDLWCFFGSSNWDPRSLRLNFELNVEVYDRPLARHLQLLFDAKLQAATEINAQQMRTRSVPIKLRDGAARLLSPYL
ncbi:phosphatidylserine/phosphatidylglycerophosphate/cardiolipin synthase [Thiorhodovibrio frisius]|uniref:Cardiolipin synthase n=2 Tax=Thiorhodovibrio frisius TaxID=631362 RepID=H8Z1Q5_9GAMM|nr:cardiolipin synthase [Thiorhodovibrio frisius]EIC21500.1 phosphatidylserine/phosphatidylglycerophosphate/cardiolipin synthase [Thiorhodovibrio frisius]WPL24086.1 Major cardiolipin synthase ClsA [Thiorhodovibrio frisius]